MNRDYRQMLLSEMRMVVYQKGDHVVDDERMAKVITVNENLKTLGYTLNIEDMARLAKSDSLDYFYDSVKELMGEVKAAPMYPDFPKQVMNMSEAQFRFHQMVHYFSTYGVERLFGVEVSRGWLPKVQATEKTEKDDTLLKAKVLEMVEMGEAYAKPMKAILGKRERMTMKECQIVQEALKHVAMEDIAQLKVTFKQNLLDVFYTVFTSEADIDKVTVLHSICQHIGDVLKCMDYCLTKCKFHFKTSQKRMLVKLMESYSVVDFKANLILSNKKAMRSLLMLQYVDYNEYARSEAHKAAVDSLRNGKLQSWESQAKYLLDNGKEGALQFVAQHPGTMLRMVTQLLRMGYAQAEVEQELIAKADSLSMQTMVTVLNYFGKQDVIQARKEADAVYAVFEKVLEAKMQSLDTSIKNAKVFLDMDEIDFAHSEMQINNKSDEGGYIRSGIAYKIPDDTKFVRFFVYWNDSDRVDIDLHASGVKRDGSALQIGWNSKFRSTSRYSWMKQEEEQTCDAVFSGDITHSDAAEYIDINMDGDIKEVGANIHVFGDRRTFAEIEECYVGMMAVKKIGENVSHYNPANCFFTHFLKSKCSLMDYGYIDVVNRCVVFDGKKTDQGWYAMADHTMGKFTMQKYLDMLMAAQGAVVVNNKDEADVVIVMGKTTEEKEVSLVDKNYFMD